VDPPESFPPPRRSLGQNFLVDPNLRRRIVEEVAPGPDETILEIGPGRGALTDGLAEGAGRLVLVELDRELARRLQERFAGDDRVRVLQQDILEVDLRDLVEDPAALRVVGNIPYNVTTPILFHLLRPPRPREIVLMVQKEVADRILAEPGTGAYGALSVGVRVVATVERLLSVPPGAFRPRPRVESTVIRIRPLDPPPLAPGEEGALRRLTRALFQWRRKQLQKTLRDHSELKCDEGMVEALLGAAGAEPADRPETVSPEGFREMARVLARAGQRFPAP
jgi:16S rRNA (adenine1518-N6/adenine1519-N6)-dimethyltransferase